MRSEGVNLMWTAILIIVLSNGQSAKIRVTPDNFIEAVTQYVTVTCTPDGTGARADDILVIAINRDGNTPVVHIQPPNKIQFAEERSDHYKAQGLVNGADIPSSYLSLTINYPSQEDAGRYICVMSYIDETGLVKQDTAEAVLLLSSTGNSSMETRVHNLEVALDHLLDRIKILEREAADLRDENQNQTAKIEVLREKTSTSVAFAAAISEDTIINVGDVLVFPDVITNEGWGYNATTGVFIAPRAGLYSFSLVLEIGQEGAAGEIVLNVAGNEVAKMYTQDRDFGDQGSISIVMRLKLGDTVKAVVTSANGNTPRALSERLCLFSGFLVRI